MTPLHVAMQSRYSFYSSCSLLVFNYSSRFIPCVQFLLDHGASYEHMVTREGNIETRKSIWQMCDENPDLIRIFGTGWTPANHQLHPECIRKAVRWCAHSLSPYLPVSLSPCLPVSLSLCLPVSLSHLLSILSSSHLPRSFPFPFLFINCTVQCAVNQPPTVGIGQSYVVPNM